MALLDETLDIMGQQPSLNIYTQITLCYPLTDASSYSVIVDTLRSGLKRLSANFPWIAGHVVNDGAGEGTSGTFKIRPFEEIPRLVVKDLSNDSSAPTMDAMRQANFPFTMLDESVIAPRNTFPGGPGETPSDPFPVFLVQATFISGGVLLTFVAAHNSMDMTGQGHVIHLLSQACRNEPFTSEELRIGNLPRHDLVPFLDDSVDFEAEIAHQIIKAAPDPPVVDEDAAHDTSTTPNCTWEYFSFDAASLAAIKSLAAKSITSGFVSTDDALTAFIWQAVMRARQPRLSGTTETTLTRAVDTRRYLGVPSTYPGLLQNLTYHQSTVGGLTEEPLGQVAMGLRAAVDPETSKLTHATRALATHINRSATKTDSSFIAKLDLSIDLMISSWSKPDCYALDFGLGLGTPEAVRRPGFTPVESLTYFMPKRYDGEIAVGICLRDEDMDRMKADAEFTIYGTFTG